MLADRSSRYSAYLDEVLTSISRDIRDRSAKPPLLTILALAKTVGVGLNRERTSTSIPRWRRRSTCSVWVVAHFVNGRGVTGCIEKKEPAGLRIRLRA